MLKLNQTYKKLIYGEGKGIASHTLGYIHPHFPQILRWAQNSSSEPQLVSSIVIIKETLYIKDLEC